jgi:hypothetical protein
MFICDFCGHPSSPGEKMEMVTSTVRPNGGDVAGFQIARQSRACPRCSEGAKGMTPTVENAPAAPSFKEAP